LLVAVLCGFLYWSLTTEAGARWVLQTAAGPLQGQVQGIQGTIWKGLRVQRLELSLPDTAVALTDLHLQLKWDDLLQHKVHIQDLSAQQVDVDLSTPAQPAPASPPFKMPALPVSIVLDRFAVGQLNVRQDGKALPVSVRNLATSLSVSGQGAQLVLDSLEVANDSIGANLKGQVKLLDFADPWPMQAQLTVQARGLTADSPLCVRRFMPTLPTGAKAPALPASTAVPAVPATAATGCAMQIEASAEGSLDKLALTLAGGGQDIHLDTHVNLTPRGAFPLQDAVFGLKLADGSSLDGKLGWVAETVGKVVRDHLTGSVRSQKLNVGQLAGPIIPPAVVTMSLDFDARLLNHQDLLSADLNLDFGADSRWNKQPLSGALKAKIINTLAEQPDGAAAGNPPGMAPADGQRALWEGLQLAGLAMDLRLGKNHLDAKGGWGAAQSRLDLNLLAPQLDAFWPGLPGGARLQGQLTGTLARHGVDLTLAYTPEKSFSGAPAGTPVKAQVKLAGQWGKGAAAQDSLEGWRGALSVLRVDYDGMGVRLQSPMTAQFLPAAVAPAWQWQVGAASVEFLLPSKKSFVLKHKVSHGGPGRWESQGAIEKIALSRGLIKALQNKFSVAVKAQADMGGVKQPSDARNDQKELVLAADWSLRFAGALDGQAHIRRLSGDVIVPGDPDFPLGLNDLVVDVNARHAGASTTRLTANIKAGTAKMGHVSATATTLLGTAAGGPWALDSKSPTSVKADIDVNDLGWLSLFAGDAMEFGGSLRAHVQAQSRPDGTWGTSGSIAGKQMRIIRIDDGVRLLDGTLAAHLDGSRLVLDSLRFPASLRVKPKEWRTAEWISTSPDAKDGSLTLSGQWDLFDSSGVVNVAMSRYPIMQRSDRYAMLSGKLKVDAKIPAIAVSGGITIDAGWFDLDMLGGIPTVDSDVVVIRPGEEKKVAVPSQITLDLTVDMGRRFYITGYGVNSGLIGNMHIKMANSKLTAMGALRTRGGSIDVYGQHLQLRRGTITFQGDIASPILAIEAVRTGVAVQAGVRVAGTAKRPRIDLVSYPDVSDVEKLSWLLLGEPPDENGGDAALLFSVGTSFLGGDEPFYRKFGIDAMTMKSGELGSTGSILPPESVVKGLDTGASDIERKFMVASKKLSNGITLSVEQALSDTGTVGRASYMLSKHLSADISGGTVSGIALIYRIFFND
jgi:translocation and assembly module TamB